MSENEIDVKILASINEESVRGGSVAFGLAEEIADAISSFELFAVDPIVQPIVGLPDNVQEIVGVSPSTCAFEREGRRSYRETRGVRVAYYRAETTTTQELSSCVDRLDRLAPRLLDMIFVVNGCNYYVDAIDVERYDEDLLHQNLIFGGALEITLISTFTKGL